MNGCDLLDYLKGGRKGRKKERKKERWRKERR
jgi:hypothetical protein